MASMSPMMPPQVGEVAPDFTLPTQRGVPTSLSVVLRDGPALIAFPGRLTHPASHAHILALARLFRDRAHAPSPFLRTLQPLVIVPNSQDEAKRYVEEVGTPFHLLCDDDGRVTTRYGVRRPLALRRDTRPALFGVDAAGAIRYRLLDSWADPSTAAIEALAQKIEAAEKTNRGAGS